MDNHKTKTLYLKGLGCANCAAKIEKQVNQLPGVTLAKVDFANGTLVLQTKEKTSSDQIVSQSKAIIHDIEPDVIIQEDADRSTLKQPIFDRALISILTGLVAVVLAWVIEEPLISLYLYVFAYIVVGNTIIIKAVNNIFKGEWFDENFLMTIATLGAAAIGEYPEAVAVMLFYRVGEYLQDRSVDHSRRSIQALLDIKPEYAYILKEDMMIKVAPEQVQIDDILIVKPGDKIPLDGVIIQGHTSLDTSMITGESLLKDVQIGDEVYSGCLNMHGSIHVKVTKRYAESTVHKILDLVQHASSNKAPTEDFITKFAKVYTPVVVLIALMLAIVPPLVFAQASFSVWLYRALVFLVISCPCALVISIPLGFFGGIGAASKHGILIKGSNHLEGLNDVSTVVFDKTGTLTEGSFKVTNIFVSSTYDEQEILRFAAKAEAHSNHPIARSIVSAYPGPYHNDITIKEHPGYGVEAIMDNHHILVGSEALMSLRGVSIPHVDMLGTHVHVAVDNKHEGVIVIADRLKADSRQAISMLKALHVDVIMLSGDQKEVAAAIGQDIGIDTVHAQLLPDQKVDMLRQIIEKTPKKHKVCFVGDGINDAPSLANADVGVAMGALGSDVAIEAADVIIMDDHPSKVAKAIMIAKRTRKIVYQNISMAMGVKLVFLMLGALGVASLWEAVFADVGVTILAVFNAIRTIRSS